MAELETWIDGDKLQVILLNDKSNSFGLVCYRNMGSSL